MQAPFWILGISGRHSLKGLQGALIQAEAKKFCGRRSSVWLPLSALLLEKPGMEAGEHRKKIYLQELIRWCSQLVERVKGRERVSPDLLSFDGLEAMGGVTLSKQDLKVVAKALEQTFHRPVVYDFQVQAGTEPELVEDSVSEVVRKAAYYKAILERERGARRPSRTALVVLDQDIIIYVPKVTKGGEILWTYVRVWPGLDCLDEWTMRSFQKIDDDGTMASRGLLITPLLSLWRREAEEHYESHQKQTEAFWRGIPELVADQTPLDVCTTLTVFTAQRVMKKLKEKGTFTSLVLIGRGRHNVFLRSCLTPSFSLLTPQDLSWDESLEEAESCAYNAIRCLTKAPAALTGNMPTPFMTAKTYDPEKLFPRSAFRASRNHLAFDRIVKA